jgi:hypothetical protein
MQDGIIKLVNDSGFIEFRQTAGSRLTTGTAYNFMYYLTRRVRKFHLLTCIRKEGKNGNVQQVENKPTQN